MQFRLYRFVALSLFIAGAVAHAQETQKCNQSARECEQQIRAMLTGKRYLGVQMKEINPGLVINKIVPESPAERADLEPGDRLMSVNGHSTLKASFDDFKAILCDVNDSGKLRIIVQRHGVLKMVDARMEPYSKAQIDKVVAQHLQEAHPAEVRGSSKQ